MGTEGGPGDGRAIENPDADAPPASDEKPVEGKIPGDAGSSGDRITKPGEGLVTKEGVNEPGTND